MAVLRGCPLYSIRLEAFRMYRQGNDFKLIPTVKMETRNPLKGYFGSVFPAICYHCRVMAA